MWTGEGWKKIVSSGYLHVISVNILLQLLGFGSVVLVADLISAEELAIIRTAQAYAAVLVILAGLGLTAPILYYCADPRLDSAEKQGMLRSAAKLTILIGGMVTAIAIAVSMAMIGLGDTTGRAYALYALTIPGLALTSLLFVYLQSRQEFARLAKNQAIVKVLSVAAVVLSTYFFGIWGFVAATVLSVYLGLIPVFRLALPAGDVTRKVTLPADFLPRAGYAGFGTFISMLGQSSDFMIMDFTNVAAADVGRYALASIFLLAASTLTGSIQAVVTPQFTAAIADPPAFRQLLRSWCKRMPVIALGVAALGLAAAGFLERYFFGAEYAGFTVYLAILMLKYVAWSNFAILGAAMAGAGIVRSGVAVATLMTLLSFAVGVPMCRAYGAEGAAWMQVIVATVSLAVIWLVQHWEFRRLFRPDPPSD